MYSFDCKSREVSNYYEIYQNKILKLFIYDFIDHISLVIGDVKITSLAKPLRL